MKRIAVNPGVLLSPVDDGYVAFDAASEQFFELNAVAALIVELCDGTRTPDEVASLVQPYVPQDAVDSVPTWIDHAIDSGLLIHANEKSGVLPAGGLDGTQLSQLAASLRDEGKTRAAYLCQRRATELLPDVAENWRDLGELAHIVGNRVAARDAYQKYVEFEPNDAEVRHLLVALGDEAVPERVPDECIQHLYERFSSCYESNMCDELGYEGPQRLYEVVEPHWGSRKAHSILDLGCGTGLAGEVFRPRASRLVGVDLSKDMLAKAEARQIYDALHADELTAWLAQAKESFDVIVACDTFIYFGDLHRVVALASRRLNPGGMLAFSVEQASENPFRLTDSGRYEHHFDHLREVAAANEMCISQHDTAFLRTEYGRDVNAHYVCFSGRQSA